MGQRTSYEPGTFSWVDLATTDAEGAKRFYRKLFGWDGEDSPAGGGAMYTMLTIEDDPVAGLYEMEHGQQSSGVPPNWVSYVTVASADESAKRAEELGGAVMVGPMDVLDAGRMAVIADPSGAAFAVWEPRRSIGAVRVNEPGCLTWNDLATDDPATAREFYGALFGWTFEAVDTGSEAGYWVIGHGGAAGGRNGGIREMTADEGTPPNWLPYFAVASTDESIRQAESAGAKLLAGPMDLPAGRIAVLLDPQGAAFAVFAGEFDD